MECRETSRKVTPEDGGSGVSHQGHCQLRRPLRRGMGVEGSLQCAVMWSEDGEVGRFSLNCFSSRLDSLPFRLLSGLLLIEM